MKRLLTCAGWHSSEGSRSSRSTVTGSAAQGEAHGSRLDARGRPPPGVLHRFSVGAADRLARSVRHFLQGSTLQIISVSSSCRSGRTSTTAGRLGKGGRGDCVSGCRTGTQPYYNYNHNYREGESWA